MNNIRFETPYSSVLLALYVCRAFSAFPTRNVSATIVIDSQRLVLLHYGALPRRLGT